MNKQVKTRFAPSPTGYVHIGSLRTALYNYLFAKKMGGTFLLRIEDTDQKRFVEGATENLMKMMKHFGLNWDEGPYYQSERTEIYRAHAQKLLDEGKAYRCFCTSERLDEMRADQQARKQMPKYDRKCLNLSQEEIQAHLDAGTPFVIRQLIPDEELQFHDLIRGDMSFHGRDVDDQVLIKSDNFPTYHLANVVDDHEMEVTHVIRGEEWLPSTPKHVWLYQAFGWTPPEFAHIPLLLNPDRSKLSKRQGDVAAEDFIKKGYLTEALINFIAFLGWNPGTEQEIFSMAELIQEFSLERVHKGGAVFDTDKLDWMNGHYLREKTAAELAKMLLPQLKQYKIRLTEEDLDEGTSPEANDLLKYTACIQTRMKSLNDGPEMLRPFLLSDFDYDLELFKHDKMKVDRTKAVIALENSIPALEKLEDYNSEDSIKEVLTEVITALGVKNGQVLWPLRVALTNEQYSPGVFELIQVMGKEKSLHHLKSALRALTK
jgi:glutamyl-tRNA synthetase